MEKEMDKKPKFNFYVLGLIVVILFALGVRIYFFSVYYDQPVWWDEGEHLTFAKSFVFDTPNTGWNSNREILAPIVFGLFLKIFNSEVFLRFIHVLLSTGMVYLTYLIGKEMFNKRIALIAALMMSVFYLHLFFTLRFGLEIIGPLFALFSVFFFWKGYVKKIGKYNLYLAAIFVALAIMANAKEGAIAISIFLFLIFTDKFKFLRDKKVWISIIIILIVFSPFMIYYSNTTEYILPRLAVHSTIIQESSSVWDWGHFFFYTTFLDTYFQPPFYLFFLFGVGIIILNLVIGFDLMIKGESKENNKYLFI
ncbi:glycosyltransferase family 39 protein, partial [Patescibacteria group bacterium]|nr:glycosyltransferase family 39 protein [Patescibacteria group bacterium]